MSEITAAAALRLEGLRDGETVSPAINALGVNFTISIDHGEHITHLPAGDTSAPQVDIEISSEDVLALADGDLDVVQAVTQRRLHVNGPIFAALGVAHAITAL